MKKKFKVRTKSRNRSESNEPMGEPIETVAPTASQIFEERLIDYVGATDLPEVVAKYAALCGSGRPVDIPIASNRPLMKACGDHIAGALRSRLEANPSEVRVEVMRYAVVSGEDAKISVKEVRKAGSSYRWAKEDGFAWIRLSPVPLRGSAVPGVAVDLVAVTFGETATSKVRSRRRGYGHLSVSAVCRPPCA